MTAFVSGLAELTLEAEDLRGAERFYRDVLGLELLSRISHSRPRRASWKSSDAVSPPKGSTCEAQSSTRAAIARSTSRIRLATWSRRGTFCTARIQMVMA